MGAEAQQAIALVAALLIILYGVFFFTSRLYGILVQLLNLMRSGWRRRAAINPLRASGRWTLLGSCLLILAFVLASPIYIREIREYVLSASGLDPLVVFMVLGPLGVGFAVLGMRCFAQAKRFSAQRASQVLAQDPRSPVVYLRSFNRDEETARFISFEGGRISTEEGDIAEIVKPLGPLIAIGQPGEQLSYFGAARLYASNDDWQQRVSEMINEAPLVILCAGESAGLMWEFEVCRRHVHPERIVILVPFGRRLYDRFRSKAQQIFPSSLPNYNGRRCPETTVRGVIVFDENWLATMRPVMPEGYLLNAIRRPFAAGDVLVRKESYMHRALREILEPTVRRLAAQPA